MAKAVQRWAKVDAGHYTRKVGRLDMHIVKWGASPLFGKYKNKWTVACIETKHFSGKIGVFYKTKLTAIRGAMKYHSEFIAAAKEHIDLIARLADYQVDAVRSIKHKKATQDALTKKKSKGERVGSIPYGKQLHSDGKRLVDNEYEMRVMEIANEFRDGGFKFRQIALRLREKGVVSRNGKPFIPTQISRMIKKED